MKQSLNATHVYFSGIGGIGMSGLAQLLRADGLHVSGSDVAESDMVRRLREKGIAVSLTQDGSSIPDGVDLCIFTSAIPENHPERTAAAERGIRFLSYFEAIGEYMQQFEHTIAISGTHGKSTTTALIANVLIAAGKNPTVLVGTVVKEFNSNARPGGKELLVVEACEHKEHMLNLHPSMIVLTNIEEDHLDYYKDLDHIVSTFQKYVNHLPSTGVLFKNADDSEVEDIGFDGTVIRYGIDHNATVMATECSSSEGRQSFTSDGTAFELRIPGRFNVYNALAAIAVARHLGVGEQIIQQTFASFTGVWRRFEVVGECKGATIVSDYAHHPTALHSTIKGAYEFFPGKRIVVLFQPHQRSRTQRLFHGFVESLLEAQYVIVQEIYDVAGREDASVAISSRDLVTAVEAKGKYAVYSPDAVESERLLRSVIEPGDVVLVMGAGDVYHVAEKLVVS